MSDEAGGEAERPDFQEELEKRIARMKSETWHDEHGKAGVITGFRMAGELYARVMLGIPPGEAKARWRPPPAVLPEPDDGGRLERSTGHIRLPAHAAPDWAPARVRTGCPDCLAGNHEICTWRALAGSANPCLCTEWAEHQGAAQHATAKWRHPSRALLSPADRLAQLMEEEEGGR